MKKILPVIVVILTLFLIISSACGTRTTIAIPETSTSLAIAEAPDDIVGTPGGSAYRANVHQQDIPDRWPSIETVEAQLNDSIYVRYRQDITTNAGEIRNNIFNIRKVSGRFEGGESINLYSAGEIPAGLALGQGAAVALPGTIAAILVIEISQDMKPGKYTINIGIDIGGIEYGTLPCNIEVLEK